MKAAQIVDRKAVGSVWRTGGSGQGGAWEMGKGGGMGVAVGGGVGRGGLSRRIRRWDVGRSGRNGPGGDGDGRRDAGGVRGACWNVGHGGQRVRRTFSRVGTRGWNVPDGVFHTDNLMPSVPTISFDVRKGVGYEAVAAAATDFFNRRGAEGAEFGAARPLRGPASSASLRLGGKKHTAERAAT